jgi:hypothetical protein
VVVLSTIVIQRSIAVIQTLIELLMKTYVDAGKLLTVVVAVANSF